MPREAGFTLIELVVALAVLAVAVAATTSVFYAGFRTGKIDVDRVNAVALASRQSQLIRLVAYPQLGLPVGTTTTSDPACDSNPAIVTVSPATVVPVDPPATIAAVAYSVSRCVQWAADSKPFGAQSYKRTTIVVTWSDQGGSHAVRQDSIAYPGGLGPAAATTTTTAPACGAPLPATDLTATQSSPTAALLAWTTQTGSPTPISSWIVQYSTDGFVTTNTLSDSVLSAGPGQSNKFIVGGLSPSVTTYRFQVIAVGPAACSSPQSAAYQSGFASAAGAPALSCVAQLVTLTPAVAPRQSGFSTLAPQSVTVTVNTNGNCSALSAQYSPSAGVTGSVPLSAATGGVWTATLPAPLATDAWDLGLHQITILQAATNVATADLCVVNQGVAAC
jgi:prepilin-type N-terminal cleavage/methylation domain-containing protein